MLLTLLAAGAVGCAFMAIRAGSVQRSALWLAGVSALIAALLYQLGAREVAVIELSVGAGLVIVLLVFSIHLTGEAGQAAPALVPRPLAWSLILLSLVLLGGLTLPLTDTRPVSSDDSFTHVLWQDRLLDVLLQIALIFAGALGVLGLLVEEAQTQDAASTSVRKPDKLSVSPGPPSGNGREPVWKDSPPEEVHG